MWQRAPAQCAQPGVLSGHHSQTPHVALPQQSSRQASIVVASAARVSSGQNDRLTEERNAPAGHAGGAGAAQSAEAIIEANIRTVRSSGRLLLASGAGYVAGAAGTAQKVQVVLLYEHC